MKTRYLAVLATLACLGFSVPAAAHECDGHKNKEHKHCPGNGNGGGGGGGSDPAVPLMTSFDCPVIGTDHLSCPLVGSHNLLQADAANSPYENDVDNVLNRMGKTGRFALSTGKQKKKPKPRSVYWDVTQVNGGILLPTGLLFTTTDDLDALGIVHRTVIHVGSSLVGQGGDLRTMLPGEIVDTDLEANIDFETGQGGTDGVFLRFSPSGGRCNGRITSSVQVTRTDDGSGKRQWTIDVPPGALACVLTNQEDLGDYVFGPFQFVGDEL